SDEEIVAWHKAGAFHDASQRIGGTLIEDDSIETRHLRADVLVAGNIKDQHNFDSGPAGIAAGGAVKIDSSGAWGYDAQGNRRAGFGTDGKWIAGGGKIEADE